MIPNKGRTLGIKIINITEQLKVFEYKGVDTVRENMWFLR